MNHKAIYKLYPNVVSVSDDIGAFDVDGKKVSIDMDLVNAWQDPDEYKDSRVLEYPSLGDQLDDLFHSGMFSEEMRAKIQAVKNKYPKS